MSITISLNNCQAASSVVSVLLPGNSGQLALSPTQGVAINGPFSFQTVLVTQSELAFGAAPGTVFDGELTLNLQPTQPGVPPAVLLTGLSSGSATVSYLTASGPATQPLTSGDPLTLTGFVQT